MSEQPCQCRRCLDERGQRAWWMILCAKCGNKRCPHATNHRLECTNSNEPGQPGSVYGVPLSDPTRHPIQEP